jgi:hypothetical protein
MFDFNVLYGHPAVSQPKELTEQGKVSVFLQARRTNSYILSRLEETRTHIDKVHA